MSAAERSTFRPEATAAFAEIVARVDRGETVDFEAEFRAHADVADELRALHANWKRLDRLLGGLTVGESTLEDLARDLRAPRTPPDVATAKDLERLSSPDRARTRYVVRGRVARGGMGEIWRVHDVDLDRDLAMKVIRTRPGEGSRNPDGKLLKRFLFEARLTGRLDHPGIVPVHDIGIDAEGRLYFTMPLVRGRSLAEILDLARDTTSARDGAREWTRSRVLEVVLNVCDALAFAHAQGVVHRDLKPANVMVGRFGETYVMDWGLARVLSELDEIDRGEVLGTPAYMAPEQAKGRLDDVGPRSDVYAVGAILYHLLAGVMPYAEADSGSGRSLLDAVRDGPPRRLDDLAPDAPQELVAIARKAMVRSPDGRYADMAAMASDLRAYMEGRVVHAHERGAWPATRKWLARHRVMAVTLATFVAIVAIGALWFSFAQGRSAGQIQRLADLRRVEELEARAETLWPAEPRLEAEFSRWLVEAESLAARAPAHEAELARLRSRRDSTSGEERDELEWQIRALSELVSRLSRFRDPFPGLGSIASVTARRAESRRLARASLEDARERWIEACAAIADPARTPAYRGLSIAPQFGLVPIGTDPVTGLWEFAHLASGLAPTRDGAGRLVLTPDTSIVLVLVPGGSFHMGSLAPVPGQPSGPRTDAHATPDEQPLTRVELAPFFVAKHETTRAQWARLTFADAPAAAEGLLPQASVSWTDARRETTHAGLSLPTEAQWEYACRAGTTTRWWCGMEPGTLRDVANGGAFVDPRLATPRAEVGPMDVDALRANGYGLVHVHGNVAEWTRDTYASYATTPRADDGERQSPENGLRAVRGGHFESPAARLRSAAREGVARDNHDPRIGVRAARAIDAVGGERTP